MNKNLLQVVRLNKLLYKALFKELTKAEFEITADNKIRLIADGDIKNIKIKFSGIPNISSFLPEGYYIKINSNTIRIRNVMGKPIHNDKIILGFDSGFRIKSASIRGWFLKTLRVKITNLNNLGLMSLSSTNFEDNTSTIEHTNIVNFIKTKSSIRSKHPITTGLYTSEPFPDGYIGYYHYFPDKKIFMTGRYPSSDSRPILNKTSTISLKNTISKIKDVMYTKNRQNLKKNKRDVTADSKYTSISKKQVYADTERIDIPFKIRMKESRIKSAEGIKTKGTRSIASVSKKKGGKY